MAEVDALGPLRTLGLIEDDLEEAPHECEPGNCGHEPYIVEAWVCDQPPRGVRYRVLRDEWVDDYRVRLIREIQVVE